MDSPFPGMDPYLERFDNDVCGPLVVYIAGEMNGASPPQFRAGLRKRHIHGGASRTGDPRPQHLIEIADANPAARVVTVIEVLLPENKQPGDGMDQFRHYEKRTLPARSTASRSTSCARAGGCSTFRPDT